MARPFPFLLYSGLTRRSARRHLDRLDRLVTAGEVTEEMRNARLAQGLPKRPKGPLLWLHAATAFALRPASELFCRIRDDRPDLNGLITLGHGVELPPGLSLDGGLLAATPEDDPNIVRRFLTHWDPDELIWIGGRFRPTLLRAVEERGLPAISIDAPKSPATLDTHIPVPGLRSAVLNCFDHAITAWEETTMMWYRAGFGSDQVEKLGFLEEGGIAPSLDEEELSRRLEELKTRPVWFATRIATAEVGDVIRAHKRALRRAHRLLLAVSLSDNAPLESVRAQFEGAGIDVMVLGQDSPISESVQAVLLPPSGNERSQDGLWHRIAPISFLGRSIAPFGGVDPYPAAAMGSAILHGPHVESYATAYARLTSGKAAQDVRDGYELGDEVRRLMAPDQAALMASSAWEISSTGAEVTDRVADLVQDFLDLRERLDA
ncbi:3-deoxy-D-manno-octulosonic acid transferase [Celeribacter neptunius]|uniref:3-deoxy-D-manno-octulosonic acid transferase n=1 Tax=Celeribacter neptunius TaxID=588602 RepID=A0A1I3S2D2_9RHOB|nr:glycosyltransferase N-terminal domain-containing protein [Celeribacter neptunius]SFJ52768.1 3-deoxy-D-manno-octulosonic-acid transferase [Celeribacter neptunius]